MNNLPITRGWNHIERMCQPKPEIVNVHGTFRKPSR
jgi:hypothetical protein